MQDLSLPADMDAERAVLCSCLIDRDAIIAIADRVTDDMFYLEKHAWVYAAISACYVRRVPPDLITVADKLRQHERGDRLAAVGGLSWLSAMMQDTPTAMHVEYYADIVRDLAFRRHTIEHGAAITRLGYNEPDRARLTTQINRSTADLIAPYVRGGFVPASSAVQSLYARVDRASRGEPASAVVPWYHAALDSIAGVDTDALVVLAARPGAGKTSLMLDLVLATARERKHVGIMSQEMSRDEIVDRLASKCTGIDLSDIRSGNFRKPGMVEAMVQACSEIDQLPISIDDTGSQTITDVCAKATRQKAAGQLDVLFVDYIQLLDGTNPRDNETARISEITRKLKLLARDLHIPIIALSQLSRAVESRTDNRPTLSDLRGSGSLEQDANIVVFIYRDDMYKKDSDAVGIAELIIAKNRNGAVGTAVARFERTTAQFKPLERYRAPSGY